MAALERSLQPGEALSTLAPMMTAAIRSLERPEPACLDCWRVWLVTAARDSIGYCRHHEIAWRVRPGGELVTAPGTNRKRHLAMVKALEQRRAQIGLGVEVGCCGNSLDDVDGARERLHQAAADGSI